MIYKKGFVGLAVIVVVSLVAVFGGGYVYYQKQKNIEQPTPQASLEEETNTSATVTTTGPAEGSFKGDAGVGVKADINIKTDLTQTVDCGSEGCFQQKFAACESATLKGSIGIAAADYKIIGPDAGGCKMTFKYTKNPNPAWVNKEMTCTYDNKIDFKKSSENTFNGVLSGTVVCTGPLYDILRAL